MRNLFKFFRRNSSWDFPGGIHPPTMKTQSSGTPLRSLPLPDHFIIPLRQHMGSEGELCVKPGDPVLRGQPLTFGTGRMLPVHAPTSGIITAIEPRMSAHPSALAEMSVCLIPDGEDRWVDRQPLPHYQSLERSALIHHIHQAGIAGLGGAGFPTASKLRGGRQQVKTLIINGAECEPYITADDRLMQEHASEIIEGSKILAWILQTETVLIGIEDNKPAAIAAMHQAVQGLTDLQLRVIPTKYPSGGAKQLTKILTGQEVPHGGHSSDIGILMQNVGTAYAVKRAIIDGEPLTERVVTVTGAAVKNPGNVWGRLGTPISHLLTSAGFHPTENQRVIMGGPLMGFTLPELDVPVVKITNCLLAPSPAEWRETPPEQSCIRCSACADACPASLLPQQLYWYSQGSDHEKAQAYHINDCIECGACAWVCPSNIPLVQYYRQEKAELRALQQETQRAADARARFEARQRRLAREKKARAARHEAAKQQISLSDQQQIAAALARVKARQPDQQNTTTHAVADDHAIMSASRAARKAQARTYQRQRPVKTATATVAAAPLPAEKMVDDPRKAAIAAAIARAKARKAAIAANSPPEQQSLTSTNNVARRDDSTIGQASSAQATRTTLSGLQTDITPPDSDSTMPDPPAQPTTEDTSSPLLDPADQRKATVAAAIARIKARKAHMRSVTEELEE